MELITTTNIHKAVIPGCWCFEFSGGGCFELAKHISASLIALTFGPDQTKCDCPADVNRRGLLLKRIWKSVIATKQESSRSQKWSQKPSVRF